MATIGRWSGGATASNIPGTTWAAPAVAIAPTEDRNDGSAYTWSGNTLTLPASDLADGYLIRCTLEIEDSSNGRFNPQGKFIQATGTGNFLATPGAGYSRDTSEDRAFVATFAVVDAPSASSTYQFQWRSDTDLPNTTDGTVEAYIEVIPLFYSNIGMYSSSTGQAFGANVTGQVNMGTTVVESDSAAISRSGNVATIKGDNKKYLILGGLYGTGYCSNRTLLMADIAYDGVGDRHTRGIMYFRQTSNADGGPTMFDLHETGTADETVEILAGSGAVTAASWAQGPEVNNLSTPTNVANSLVILELNDSAEGIRGYESATTLGVGTGSQAMDGTAQVDLNAINTTSHNDAASFTRASATAINTEVAMDALVGGTINTARSNGASTTRHTVRTHLTVNGVADATTLHGNYCRGDQSTTGTRGMSMHSMGALALSIGDDIGLSSQEITGTEGGTSSSMGVSIFAINLDTLEDVPAGDVDVPTNLDTLVLTERAATITSPVTATNVATNLDTLVLTTQTATIGVDTNVTTNLATLTLTEATAAITLPVTSTNITTNLATLVLTEQQAAVIRGFAVDTNLDTLVLTTHQALITKNVEVLATTEALSLGTNAANIALDLGLDLGLETLTLTEHQALVSLGVRQIVSVVPDSFADTTTGILVTTENVVTPGATVWIDGVEQTVTGTTADSITFTAVQGTTALGGYLLIVKEISDATAIFTNNDVARFTNTDIAEFS